MYKVALAATGSAQRRDRQNLSERVKYIYFFKLKINSNQNQFRRPQESFIKKNSQPTFSRATRIIKFLPFLLFKHLHTHSLPPYLLSTERESPPSTLQLLFCTDHLLRLLRYPHSPLFVSTHPDPFLFPVISAQNPTPTPPLPHSC